VTSITAIPAGTDTRAPQIMRLKMSRPRSSVPRTCPAPGGLRRSKRFCALGSAIGSNGAKSPTKSQPTIMAIPANESGRPPNVCATLVRVDRYCRGELSAKPTSGGAVAATLAFTSGDPDPGVEDSVNDVDHEIHEHIHSRHEQRDSQQSGIVELQRRLDAIPSDTRPGEDRFS
jgi:hypothetical protein